MVAGAMASPALTAPAQASVAGATHSIPGGHTKSADVTVLCYDATGFSCAGAGYSGQKSDIHGNGWTIGDYWTSGSGPVNGPKHNCTTYAAYRLQQNGYAYPRWTDNANGWALDAANPSRKGSTASAVTVDQTPIAGSIAEWGSGANGHVAYVEAVSGTYIVTTSDSYGGGTDRLKILYTSKYMPDNFIHFKDTYVGALVQWNKDTKAQKTTWRVGVDGRRHWVPSISVTSRLLLGGATTGPYLLSAAVLNTIPDDTNSWASDGADLNGDGIVNIKDLSILAGEMGKPGHQGDINLDGTVNNTDLSILQAQYGKAPTPVVIPAP
jgi:surface antigen